MYYTMGSLISNDGEFALSQTLSRLLQKGVMHVQGCCFADLTYYLFAVLVAVAVVVAYYKLPNVYDRRRTRPSLKFTFR